MNFVSIFILFCFAAVAAASSSSSSSSSSSEEPTIRRKPALRAAYKNGSVAENRFLGRNSEDKTKQTHVRVESKNKKNNKKAGAKTTTASTLTPGVVDSRVSFRTGTSRASTRSQCSSGANPAVNNVKNYQVGYVGASACISDNDCMSGCCLNAYVTGFTDACFDVEALTDHVLTACKLDTVCDVQISAIPLSGGLAP